jgi:hypothetical protein
MTQEEFIEVLKKEKYSYKIEGDKIVVTDTETVWLDSLASLPPDVVFKNKEDIYMQSLTSISPDVELKNKGDIYMESLTSIPPGVVFKNKGAVYFGGGLIGGWFYNWGCNIEGIDSKRLLNLMIKRGMFI